MRRRRVIVGVLTVGIFVLSGFAIRRTANNFSKGSPEVDVAGIAKTTVSPLPSNATVFASSTPNIQKKDWPATVISSVFEAPISFFGKVQDQNGIPIVDAKVEFGAIDKLWEAGSDYHATSDGNGLFSISGIKGAGLTVAVSKDGYDGIKGLSYQSFGYGMGPDSTRKPPPSRDTPAIFVLRKKAPADPLLSFRRDIILPKDGTAVEINVAQGGRVVSNGGDMVIRCWTTDDRKDPKGRYSWRAEISSPGGGFMARTDQELAFVAPEEGYAATVEINMPQQSLQWREESDAEYWFRLGNGRYGRMRCRITTGGSHFATISAFINPTGSRNLEYDPNNKVELPPR